MSTAALSLIYLGGIGFFTAALMYLADHASDNWP